MTDYQAYCRAYEVAVKTPLKPDAWGYASRPMPSPPPVKSGVSIRLPRSLRTISRRRLKRVRNKPMDWRVK